MSRHAGLTVTSVGKNGTGKKAQEKMAQEKRAQGKNGTGNNATKCMIGKNGTSLFQLSKIITQTVE